MDGSKHVPQTDWGPVRRRTLVCFYVREFGAVITIIYSGWFFYWSIYRLFQICGPFFSVHEVSQIGLCANRTGATLLRVRAHSWWRACAHSWPSARSGYRWTAGGSDHQTVTPTTPGQIFYPQALRMRGFCAVQRVSNEVDRLRVASKPRLNCVHLLREPISRW